MLPWQSTGYKLNRIGDKQHPCLAPDTVLLYLWNKLWAAKCGNRLYHQYGDDSEGGNVTNQQMLRSLTTGV